MLLKKKIIPAMLGTFVCLGLVACGSDSTTTVGVAATTTSGDTTGDTPTGSSTNAVHTIVLTYPHTDSITNEKNGTYSRVGEAIVTDNEGNPVPDGTKVYLNVVDSVLATGTIGAGDSITGAVLTDTNPLQADGAATTFDVAAVYRNSEFHFIESADHVLLFNSDASDRNRVVSADDGTITANTLTVSSDYSMDYPDATYYTTGTTDYVVGVSSLGAHVLGTETDADGNVTVTANGYSLTKNGRATFYVVYPANVNTIRTGCINPVLDTRVSPVGSAVVYLIASAGANATTVDSRFCFSSIDGWTLDVKPTAAITGTSTLDFTLEDGGDEIRLPFSDVTTSVATTGAATVTLDDQGLGAGIYRTDASGEFSSTITLTAGNSADTATITYASTVGGATVDVVLTVP